MPGRLVRQKDDWSALGEVNIGEAVPGRLVRQKDDWSALREVNK